MGAPKQTEGATVWRCCSLIFTTVGSQEPFDRLIRGVDEWAALRERSDVFAQLARSEYKPKNIEHVDFVSPSEYLQRMKTCRLIVAHAGMGSILSAMQLGKPIVVMPRRAHLRETRDDHQVAAARRFEKTGKILVAHDETELAERLDHALTLKEGSSIGKHASPRLLATIRDFLDNNCQS